MDKELILSSKSKGSEYVVFQESSKTNAQDVDQCEKYLEIKSVGQKTEILGADIADLFSHIYDIEKTSVKLLAREPVFYNITYTGNNHKEVFPEIHRELMAIRKLQVKKINEKKEVFYLPIEAINSSKAKAVKSNGKNVGASVVNQNGMIFLKNSSLKILIQTLNSNFANNFYYDPLYDHDVLFELDFPTGKSIKETIEYIERNYGLKFSKKMANVQTYTIYRQ